MIAIISLQFLWKLRRGNNNIWWCYSLDTVTYIYYLILKTFEKVFCRRHFEMQMAVFAGLHCSRKLKSYPAGTILCEFFLFLLRMYYYYNFLRAAVACWIGCIPLLIPRITVDGVVGICDKKKMWAL